MDGDHYQLLSLVDWNTESLQDEDWGSRWESCNDETHAVVRDSICEPSVVVLSFLHQNEDLALKQQ